MPLYAGSVSVSSSGVASGNGLALVLFNAELSVSAAAPAVFAEVYGTEIGANAKAALVDKKLCALRATAQATALVNYLLAEAEVTVTGVEAGGDTVMGSLG